VNKPFRINFPPDPNPKKPKFKLPPGSWDTHFHVVGPAHLYPYKGTHDHYYITSPIEHYLAVAEVLGFERGVVVQPRVHSHDTAIIYNALEQAGGRLRGMICNDSNFDDGDLNKLHAAGVRGMRVELRSGHGAYDETAFKLAVKRAQKMNWVIALHVDPDSVVEMADLIASMPVPTIIENYCQVDARMGLDQPALKVMLDLAGEPHIWLKCASAYRMLRKGATYEQVLPIARAVHARSPDRSIWGTDWPHGSAFKPGMMHNDGDLVDMLLDFVPDEVTRRKLLADNPKRLFDFD
jgi:predicted TIM-barrel fold metal-dependent hydrolase